MTSANLPPSLPYSDLWAILKRSGRSIIAFTCLFGFFGFLYALSKPTWHRATATFQEKTNSSQKSFMQSDGLLSSLVAGGASSTSQQNFYSLIRSRAVLEPAIAACGLQARLRPLLHPSLFLLHLTDHLRVEGRYWMEFFDPDSPFEPLFPSSLRAKNLTYTGESTLWYTLSFLSDRDYILHDTQGNRIGTGTLEAPFSNPTFTVTFAAEPLAALAGMHFRFKLISLEKAGERCQSHLTTRAIKEREKLFLLTFYHPNRFVASQFLNQLLHSYQNYHLQEAARFAEQERQLWHEQRQQALTAFEEKIRNQVATRSALIAQTGLVDPEKQLHFLLSNQQKLQLRKEQLMQEQARCSQLLALPIHSPLALLMPCQNMPEELKNMVRAYLNDYTEKQLLTNTLEQTDAIAFEENAFKTHFEGLDLASAQAEMLALQHVSQETASSITQHKLLLKQLDDPAFPLSSLTEALEDPTSRDMLLHARTLQAQLYDPETYLDKERLQIQHTLEIQRKDTTQHLKHRLESLILRHQEIKSQIHTLRHQLVQLLTERLGLHKQEVFSAVTALSQSLRLEEKQVNQEIKLLEKSLTELLPLWTTGQIEQVHLEMQKTILEERSKWLESTQALLLQDLLRSAPVDLATPPLFPTYPGVLFFTLMGLLLGALPSSLFALMSARRKGLIASPQLLALMGQSVIGTLAPLPEKNSELLRRLSAKIVQTQTATLWTLFLEEAEEPTELITLLKKEGKQVRIEKSSTYGTALEEPEELISLLKTHQSTRNEIDKETLTLFLTRIPVTSGRALQLMPHAHGSIIFLMEESIILTDLMPIWNQEHLFSTPHPLFFLFAPLPPMPSQLLSTWRSFYLNFQREREGEVIQTEL